MVLSLTPIDGSFHDILPSICYHSHGGTPTWMVIYGNYSINRISDFFDSKWDDGISSIP